MSPQLLLIAGLPGSGKSMYLEELQSQAWVQDEFKNRALNDSPRFRHSRHYPALVDNLSRGRKCVIADIDFCCTQSRDEAEAVLKQSLPTVRFEWCFFEKDFAACEANIHCRNRASLDEDLRQLRRYFDQYEIPVRARTRPVYRKALT